MCDFVCGTMSCTKLSLRGSVKHYQMIFSDILSVHETSIGIYIEKERNKAFHNDLMVN